MHIRLMIVAVAVVEILDAAPFLGQNKVRLCSKNLSNALSLLCQEHGYHEPFSDDATVIVNGNAGIVEECCYNECTLEQLALYCKTSVGKQSAKANSST